MALYIDGDVSMTWQVLQAHSPSQAPGFPQILFLVLSRIRDKSSNQNTLLAFDLQTMGASNVQQTDAVFGLESAGVAFLGDERDAASTDGVFGVSVDYSPYYYYY